MSSVDVIIPCYNYGHFLQECVQSVLSQASVEVRVLILDDASKDDTAEVAADLARANGNVTFVRHATNKGHIATFNEGIEWTSADYSLLLSADDYLLPDALGSSARLMDRHPEIGLTFGKVIQLQEDNSSAEIDPFKKGPPQAGDRVMSGVEFIEYSGGSNIVPAPTAIVRTELQKRLGGYRPDMPHTGDMEMWLRLAAHASVGFVDACQAVYRRHDENMSLMYSVDGMLPDIQQRKATFDYFFQTSGANLPNADRLKRKIYRALGSIAVGKASFAFNEGNLELSEKLSQFSLAVCPDIKRSVPWAKFACKRMLGFERWQAVRSARDAVVKLR
ncbi:glycosyltransferase family 2 protein [Microvirga sp. 2MCAF38]|uniref:glycosyltransferase family 2 protein n=1 Tax=Microvirga sp. 2MCAF38 TaxID=3232989 RepID=UPI003F959EDB